MSTRNNVPPKHRGKNSQPNKGRNNPRKGKEEVVTKTTTKKVVIPRNPNPRSQPSHRPRAPPVSRGAISIAAPNEAALVEAYVACLLKPSEHLSRVPDADTRASTIIHSVQEFNITAYFDDTADSGRFSIATRPTLGNLSAIAAYKTAMAQPSRTWTDIDWTLPSSYANLTNGQDPRIDMFEPVITQPSNFFLLLTGGGSMSPNQPLGSAPVQSVESYGLNIMLNVTTSTLTLPLGTFLLCFEGKNGANMVAPTVTFGTMVAVFTTLNISNTTNIYFIQWSVQVHQAGTVTLNFAGSDSPLTSSFMSISPAYFNGETASQGGGITKLIRPVASSILFTATLPALTAGGDVSAAFVPATTCATNYYTNNGNSATQVGQLQNWDQLGQITGSFQGLYTKGAYVWWSPETVSDRNFSPPGRNQDYPCMIISGQVATNGAVALTGVVPVGRIIVTTVYEIYCNSPLFPQQVCMGSDAIMDCAKRMVALNRHAMENKEHVAWFKKAMADLWDSAKSVGKFAYDNRAAIGSLISSGAALV